MSGWLQGLRSKMATVGEQIQISSHTVDKVTKAKVTLENYYSNLISQHEEREHRYASHRGDSQSPPPQIFIMIRRYLGASAEISILILTSSLW